MKTITRDTFAGFTEEDFAAVEEAITAMGLAAQARGQHVAPPPVARIARDFIVTIVRLEQGQGKPLEAYAGKLGLALMAIGYSFAHLEIERDRAAIGALTKD